MGNLISLERSPVCLRASSCRIILGFLTRGRWHLCKSCVKWFQELDWIALSFVLPINIIQTIQAVPLNLSTKGNNAFAWSLSKDRNFSLNSAYPLAKGLNPFQSSPFSYFGFGWLTRLRESELFFSFALLIVFQLDKYWVQGVLINTTPLTIERFFSFAFFFIYNLIVGGGRI